MKFQIKKTSKFPHEEPIKGTVQETINDQDIWTKEFNSLDELMDWVKDVLKKEKFEERFSLEGVIINYSPIVGLPTLELYDTYRE